MLVGGPDIARPCENTREPNVTWPAEGAGKVNVVPEVKDYFYKDFVSGKLRNFKSTK